MNLQELKAARDSAYAMLTTAYEAQAAVNDVLAAARAASQLADRKYADAVQEFIEKA